MDYQFDIFKGKAIQIDNLCTLFQVAYLFIKKMHEFKVFLWGLYYINSKLLATIFIKLRKIFAKLIRKWISKAAYEKYFELCTLQLKQFIQHSP